MRVLFTSLRNTSHFLPLVPFIEACRSHGHEVAVAAPPDLAERVGATGAAFFPFGHPGDEGLRPIWKKMPGASEAEARRIAIGELFAGACAGAALPGLLETVGSFRPSLVVRESQEYAAVVASEKHGVRHARVSITARYAETELFAIAAPEVDAHGLGAGLPPDPAADRLKQEAVLTLFPPSLDAAEASDSVARRFRVARNAAPPLPDWWGGGSAPFVYATLGTVTGGMDAMRSAYRPLLDALAGVPARVLLTVGANLPLELLGNVPAHVHVERFVAQDDVLPHAAAVVCHGGSGTVLGTLAAGVPMVVAPMFADQPMNAERVAALGAGLALPRQGANAEDMRRAVVRVLEEGSFRAAAQRLMAEIAALPPVSAVGAELERLVAEER